MERLRAFLNGRRAATMIEYGLIASVIAVVIIGALTLIGSDTSNTFNAVANSM